VKVDRFGLASAVALIMEFEEQLGMELAPEVLFEYPALSRLSQYLTVRQRIAAEVA
jgi:acyl carrier protein